MFQFVELIRFIFESYFFVKYYVMTVFFKFCFAVVTLR